MSAERPWSSLFAMLGHVDVVHGTYYAFLHLWIGAFGASAFSVRLPSAIATGLTTAGLVVLAQRLGDSRMAAVSAIVYLVIPRVTYMGGEARGYALSAACAVWLTVLLVHLLGASPGRRVGWIGYAVLLAISVYVFMYLALMIVVHAAVILSVTRERRMLRRWLTASALGLALAAPVLFFGVAERSQISFLAHGVTVDFGSFFVDQWFWSPEFALPAWACIVAAFVVCLRERRPGSARAPSLALLTVAWFVIPLVLVLSANLVVPVYTSRYMSFLTPAVALMIGAGLCALRRRRLVAVAVCVLVAISLPIHVQLRGPFAMPGGSDWADVAATVGRSARPGDAIVFTEGGSPSLNPRSAMHLYPRAFAGLRDVTLVTPYSRSTGLWDVTMPVSKARARLARGNGRVWLVLREEVLPATAPAPIAALKRQGFDIVKRVRENFDVVYLLTRADRG